MQLPSLVGWLWAAFILFWVILAQFNKKTRKSALRWDGLGLRLAIIISVLIIVSLRRHDVAALFGSLGRSMPVHPGRVGRWVGLGLCLVGFAFAAWARWHIGRNWGMPMSLRQGHELVTSGPYTYVRHPIYSGIMLAMIGSALVEGLPWLILFAFYFAYFLFSARTEEKMMRAQFPDAYPAYTRRTKMLVPFVF